MKKFLSVLLRVLACLVAEFLLFWYNLPALNPRSGEFWSFLFESIVICSVIVGISSIVAFIKKHKNDGRGSHSVSEGKEAVKNAAVPVKVIGFVLAGIIVFSILMSIIGAKLFNASGYSSLLDTKEGNFSADVAELSMSQIPVVDRNTASRLGQRKLGEMSDIVSQFEIEDDYTQINYKNEPVRVTPLKYAGFIKWWSNHDEGVPAYLTVNLTTQETRLIRLSELGLDNISYSRSEYFWHNLERYLRFKYPTKIFDNISFEIDENGTPYWVASVVSYRVGFWNGADISGAVILNAVTGESSYYPLEDIPRWVDQAFDAEMVVEQLSNNGLYSGGFWNSVFGQKGCTQPTDGYNYIAIDDDVWLYTGITSVTADESNIGFVLINLRTKEANYYNQAGAEEYSAMDSAEGQVQHLSYSATFPILLNVSNRPTYFMSLTDAAGLVKMYAFVDMEQYQIVGTGTSVDKARDAYVVALTDEKIPIDPEAGKDDAQVVSEKVSGTVSDVSPAVIDGTTCYYIMLEGNDKVYILSAVLSDRLPFVKAGDSIEFLVADSVYSDVRITAATVAVE